MKITSCPKRFFSLLLLGFCLLTQSFALSSCSVLQRGERAPLTVARYGGGGRKSSLDIVQNYPFRAPGSPEEKALAEWLKAELEHLGLQVEMQSFQVGGKSSQNVLATIKGKGFKPVESQNDELMAQSAEMQHPADLEGRRLILGAHYDTLYSRAQAEEKDQEAQTAEVDEEGNPVASDPNLPKLAQSDGIDDNAAALGVLLQTARLLAVKPAAYDVTIAFFGAGHADFAGAKFAADQLSPAEREKIDALVVLDSIYAGDKVYAHAGQNSVESGEKKKYALRRKLYECTDVYYDNLLLTRNGFALYTNQAGCEKELAGVGKCIYREWTEKKSDYSPFDQLGIPIVFFDSGDYDIEQCDSPVKESNDPFFASVNGMIAGSGFDSSDRLLNYFVSEKQQKNRDRFGRSEETSPLSEERQSLAAESSQDDYLSEADRLEIRINNLAFILEQLCRNVPPGTVAKGAKELS